MPPLCTRQTGCYLSEKGDQGRDMGTCEAAAESSADVGRQDGEQGVGQGRVVSAGQSETGTPCGPAGGTCTCFFCPDNDVRFGTVQWCDCGGAAGSDDHSGGAVVTSRPGQVGPVYGGHCVATAVASGHEKLQRSVGGDEETRVADSVESTLRGPHQSQRSISAGQYPRGGGCQDEKLQEAAVSKLEEAEKELENIQRGVEKCRAVVHTHTRQS